jgi:hypothetical protein
MTIEERISAMRAGRATQTKTVVVEKKLRLDEAQPEVAVAQASSTETVFDISNNTVARIMGRDDLSDKGKLEAVVLFLTATDADYHAAQKHFGEFEAYFTYVKSKRTQVSEENIQRLMDELADGTKSTVKHILDDFNSVNTGAGTIKQLLRVMEKARDDGRTIETLTEAYRFNEKLLQELATLNKFLVVDEKQEVLNLRTQTSLENEKKTADNFGFFRKVMAGGNERLAEALYYSTYGLKATQTKIMQMKQVIAEKEALRNSKLEDGELTILRSVDATEGGLTDQILTTAQDSLSLIKGTRASIESLLAANARSRAACVDITATLARMAGTETILKGALQVVAKQSHGQSENLHKVVERVTLEKASAGDEAEATLLTVKLDHEMETVELALDYERVLQAKVISFEMLASANVQAEARAQQFTSLVDAQNELLSNLQQQALPITASALEMGLQQGVALRDGMLAAGVRDATRKAQEIFGSNLDGAAGAQIKLESENLDQMRAAIAALGKAQTLISSRTDKEIEHGLNELELVQQVRSSAGTVRAAMADFQKVNAGLANRDVAAAPAVS